MSTGGLIHIFHSIHEVVQLSFKVCNRVSDYEEILNFCF